MDQQNLTKLCPLFLTLVTVIHNYGRRSPWFDNVASDFVSLSNHSDSYSHYDMNSKRLVGTRNIILQQRLAYGDLGLRLRIHYE